MNDAEKLAMLAALADMQISLEQNKTMQAVVRESIVTVTEGCVTIHSKTVLVDMR